MTPRPKKRGRKLYTARQYKLVRLYLHGGEGGDPRKCKGDWDESASAAGYLKVPFKTNKVFRYLLGQMGVAAALDGALPTLDSVKATDATTLEWQEYAARAKPTLEMIALGELDASPGQVAALKVIVERAEGRAGASQAQERPSAVLVLPALQSGAETRICPNCGTALAARFDAEWEAATT